MVGQTLGSYQILRQIGAGAMGEVYLAEHRHLKRKAAVKLLAPELVGRPDLLERFFLEARATSAIDHPGIVQIFDCEVDPTGRPYIVMEYLEGETLAALIGRQGPLPGLQVARMTRAMADALEAAHAKGIVHRDLKPENIFVLAHPPETVKLVDFGIAKLAGDFRAAQVHQTRSGAMMGTPLYMSPEQCRDSANTDFRTDLYSLGCVVFEMLTGRPPFTQDALGDLVVAHLTLPPPDARSVNPKVPPALAELVGALLQKNPAERPASMREVARQMAGFVARMTTVPDGRPDAGQATGPAPSPSAASAAASAFVPAPGEAKIKTTFGDATGEVGAAGTKPRRRTPLVAGVTAAALALGLGGLYASRLGASRVPAAGSTTAATVTQLGAATANPPAGPANPVAPPAASPAPPPTATVVVAEAEPTKVASPASGPPGASDPLARADAPPGSSPTTKSASPRSGKRRSLVASAIGGPAGPGEPPPEPPPGETPRRADFSGSWEGPWTDPSRHQNGRLFVQITEGGTITGWMSNLVARQSFRMAGRMLGPGDLALSCQCPPRQEFGARVVLHPGGASELKGKMALSAATGVFGESHVLLRRATGPN